MADDFKPPGEGQELRVIPRSKVDRAEAQKQANQKAAGLPVEPTLANLYNDKAEALADPQEVVGAKRKAAYKQAAVDLADQLGMSYSEFQRRAEFVAMRHPTLLASVDDLEAEYKSTLGGSRWHKPTEKEPGGVQ